MSNHDAANLTFTCTANSAGELIRQIKEFCRGLCGHHRRKRLINVTLRFGQFVVSFKGDFKMGQPLKNGQQVVATVQFLDSDGNPVTPETTPVWATDNPNATKVTASADGLTATVAYVGKGVSNVTCTETNNDGTTDVLTAEVDTTDDATGGSISFGTPGPITP